MGFFGVFLASKERLRYVLCMGNDALATEPKMSNSNALTAFTARLTKINEALAFIQAQADDHFEVNPDELNWGNVGDLARIEDLLNQVVTQLKGTEA